MHRFHASPLPAHVYTHVMAARAAMAFGAFGSWSAAAAATTNAKRTSKRTARHLGTGTT